MSLIAWCWLAWIVILTIGGIRCVKEVIAMPRDWIISSSSFTEPKEGDHAADQQDR